MLRVDGLTAGYGSLVVLRRLTFRLPPGGVHVVRGPNGAGKTTLVQALSGLIRPREGSVHLGETALHRLPAHRVARAGVALVPQGRRVFGSLTVAEHLSLAGRASEILDALPPLRGLLHRQARYLSGGEQQLLAIARALATGPRLLLLDEPTEGLAPALESVVEDLIETVAARGVTVLVTASSPGNGLSIKE